MSELINASGQRGNLRRQLLITVSALALVGAVYDEAYASDDAERPAVWIELGGQLEQVSDGDARFAPPFILATPRPSIETISPVSLEHAPRFSIGGEGKISFTPTDNDWVFSASVRYGRSNSSKHVRQQSYPVAQYNYFSGHKGGIVDPLAAQFVDTKVSYDESHAIVDFEAGKDVGLGVFGFNGTSILNFGVRFAQFMTKSNVALKSDPDWHFVQRQITFTSYGVTRHFTVHPGQPYHSNAGQLMAARSFEGIGPSLSWNGSMPVVGHPDASEIALDWGANAAVLFGRQRASVQQNVIAYYHGLKYPVTGSGKHVLLYHHATPIPDRRRSVIVPNIGGFAGVSFHYAAAKVSFGYRADFFFGAMDGGIDTAKTENRGFYGPFASISIGLGG